MPVIKIRRGTTTQWNASSRVLQVGELGIDTTLNRIKAGNGVSVWSALPYLSLSSAEIEELNILKKNNEAEINKNCKQIKNLKENIKKNKHVIQNLQQK